MASVRANSTARRRPRRNTKAEPLEIVDPKTFVWPERSRKNFVQLVALQCLLNPTPARRPVQPVDQTADSREKRGGYKGRLPPKVERDLTEHFAFLVAAGAGGTACCVEEEYVIDVGSTLRFRVAMNDGVPQWILDGLRGVCAEISKLANGEMPEANVKSETWRRVLDLERPRIHADLEGRFSKTSKPLSELFEESLGPGGTAATESLADEEARLVLRKIYDLCARVVTLDREKSGRDLERLLDTCYRFRTSRSFKGFLKSVQSRKELTRVIEKLGRYKTASVALVSAARKYPEMFKNLQVEATPPLSSESVASVGFHGIYVGDVARDLTANTEQYCLKRLRSVTDLNSGKLATRYQELCQEKLAAHAEIQMVKFYEENPHIGRPAFIGNSKKSCYLCTLFLQLEGKFDVSTKFQSHYQPTIHNSWTVPTIHCSSPENAVMYTFVVDKMSRILEDSCRKVLWENSSREAKFGSHFTSNFPLTSQVLGLETPSSPLPSPTPVSRMVSNLRAIPRMPSSYLSSGATTPTNVPMSPLSPTFFGNRTSLGLISAPNSRVQSPGLIPMAISKIPRKQTPALEGPPTPTMIVKPSKKASSVSGTTIVGPPAAAPAPSPRPRKHTPSHLPITPPPVGVVTPLVLPDPVLAAPERKTTPVIAPVKGEPSSEKKPVPEGESTPNPPDSPGAETTDGSESLFDLLVLPIQKHSPLLEPTEIAAPSPSPTLKPALTQAEPATPPRAPRVAPGPAPLPSPPSSTGSISRPRRARKVEPKAGFRHPHTPAETPPPSSISSFAKSEPIRAKPMVNFSRPTCEFPPTPPSSCTASLSIPWPARTETVMTTSSPTTRMTPPSRPSTPANPPSPMRSLRRRAVSPPTTSIPRPSSRVSARMTPPPSTEFSSPVSSVRILRRQTPPETAAMAVSMATSIPRLSKSPSLRSSRRTPPVLEARGEMVTSAIALEASSKSWAGVDMNRVSSDSGQTSAGGVALSDPPETQAAASRLPFTTPEFLKVVETDPSRDTRGDSMEVHVTPRNEDGESLHEGSRGESGSGDALTESLQSSLKGSPKLAKLRHVGDKELEPSFIRRRYIEGEERSLKAVAERSANGAETYGKPRSQGMNVERNGIKRDTPPPPSKLPGPFPAKDGSSLLNISGTHRSTRNKSGGVETEYTLYLASQSQDRGLPSLGEKLFSGKLSDRKGPGEIKQRVGCRLRTELRPREGGAVQSDKMRVKQVVKSFEEMVLDIFFPDAVLRLEVFWDA